MTDPSRTVLDLTLAVPLDRVWQALREPDLVATWFGWHYPDLAAEIEVIFVSGAREVPGEPSADGIERRTLSCGGDMFHLEARGSGTRIRLVRSGPLGAGPWGGGWNGIYDDVDEGWTTFLHQLRFALERQAGAARRTLYLSGRPATAEATRPIATLGLPSEASAGDRYSVPIATPDPLAGTVWFRSAHQVGVVVDALGPGLLIAAEHPPKDKAPHGGGFAVLTTYGLSDTAFAELRERWTRWWRERYPDGTIQ